jgi:P27 family predicted phage terminase small subunit
VARPRKDPSLKAEGSKSGVSKRKRVQASRASLRWQPSFSLSDEGRAIFVKIAESARDLGYITASDMPAMTRYAEYLSMWVEASRVLRPEKDGGEGLYVNTVMTDGENTMKRLHPAFRVMSTNETRIAALEAQFGFTPAARYAILQRLANGQFRASGDAAESRDQAGLPLDVGPATAHDYFVPAGSAGTTH